MNQKMTSEVVAELERAEREDPGREIPVIVTIRDWSKRDELRKFGFRVNHEFERIAAVSGTLTSIEGRQVANLETVERIELDGEVVITPT